MNWCFISVNVVNESQIRGLHYSYITRHSQDSDDDISIFELFPVYERKTSLASQTCWILRRQLDCPMSHLLRRCKRWREPEREGEIYKELCMLMNAQTQLMEQRQLSLHFILFLLLKYFRGSPAFHGVSLITNAQARLRRRTKLWVFSAATEWGGKRKRSGGSQNKPLWLSTWFA